MKFRGFVRTIAIVFLFFCAPVVSEAGENLLQNVLDGCQTELDTYCKDVTPGESRVAACVYARSDKLSPSCEYALYEVAIQLERALADMTYLVNKCSEDMNKFCIDVEAGEGRILTCLDNNTEDVSKRCNEAIAEVRSR